MGDKPRITMLTGAGFTKNFGGWLASEMNGCLSTKLLEHFSEEWAQGFCRHLNKTRNYEEAFALTLADYPSFATQINKLLLEAFTLMHQDIHKQSHNAPSAQNYPTAILSRIRNFNTNGQLILFTLNQDVFLEHNIRSDSGPTGCWFQVLDGRIAPQRNPHFLSTHQTLTDDFEQICVYSEGLTTKSEKLEEMKVQDLLRPTEPYNISYVKLHGSIDWQDNEGNTIIVNGNSKDTLITKHSILQAQYKLFEQALAETDCLVLYGYSMRDTHINKSICSFLPINSTIIVVSKSFNCNTLPLCANSILSNFKVRSSIQVFEDFSKDEYLSTPNEFELINLITEVTNSYK